MVSTGNTSNSQGSNAMAGADPLSSRLAIKLASRVAKEMDAYSCFIDKQKEEAMPSFKFDEIIMGKLLGKGGFNDVYTVESIDLIKGYSGKKVAGRRTSVAKSAASKYLAVKLLQPNIIQNSHDYSNGAADLIVETKLLTSMTPHPNIIKLHGIPSAGIGGFSSKNGGYFLLLDRLHQTLDKRIKSYRKTQPKQLIENSFLERLEIAVDLSSAMAHIHKHYVVFRDLKPDNVGFDSQGNVKIFDFGLAKELDPRYQVTSDEYKMTGKTGSRRYMAPEVALSQPYGLSADVYSFGLLLWQLLTLEEPYQGMKIRDHTEFVVKGNDRPKLLKKKWSSQLCNILSWSWHADGKLRPPMTEMNKALKREMTRQEEELIERRFSNKPSVSRNPASNHHSLGKRRSTWHDQSDKLKSSSSSNSPRISLVTAAVYNQVLQESKSNNYLDYHHSYHGDSSDPVFSGMNNCVDVASVLDEVIALADDL